MNDSDNQIYSKNTHRFSVEIYIFIFLFSVLYLALFSLWTSPFYKNWYGCDASFFTMAGRGIVNGWVPYKDFFDLKGPYFFFVEALGQLFFIQRGGAFLIQVFALFFSIVLILKLSQLFLPVNKTLFVLFVFLLGHIATLWGGNTLEEFCLPLSLLCLYVTVKDYVTYERYEIKASTALITGVCFSIILFSKITVAAPIVGIVLASIIIFIKQKKYKALFFYLLYSLLGVLIGCTPIFIYFGIKGNILDMLYSVFIFAFKRSVGYGDKIDLNWEFKISGCYFAAIFAICQLIHKKSATEDNIQDEENLEDISDSESDIIINIESNNTDANHTEMSIIILCMSVITAILLHLGSPFIYYFTTSYPSLLFALIIMFAIYDPFILFKTYRVDIPAIAFMLFICFYASNSAGTLKTVIYDKEADNNYYQDYVDSALEMASFIPVDDRDSVYSFNMDMQWFEITQILPCYKYQVNLQFFVSLDNRIETEILDYLNNTPPKWLVVGGELDEYLPNVSEVVFVKYEDVYQNDYGTLYLLQ